MLPFADQLEFFFRPSGGNQLTGTGFDLSTGQPVSATVVVGRKRDGGVGCGDAATPDRITWCSRWSRAPRRAT
jgi:hypothetical protein